MTKRERICSFGDCDKTEIRVIVTLKSYFQQDGFCSVEHAIKFLVGKAIYPATIQGFLEKFGEIGK